MPFLPDKSLYIGKCKDCKEYPDSLTKSPCCRCDPIGGINFWHHKDYETYEEWKKTLDFDDLKIFKWE